MVGRRVAVPAGALGRSEVGISVAEAPPTAAADQDTSRRCGDQCPGIGRRIVDRREARRSDPRTILLGADRLHCLIRLTSCGQPLSQTTSAHGYRYTYSTTSGFGAARFAA